jgi:hypothetical protein
LLSSHIPSLSPTPFLDDSLSLHPTALCYALSLAFNPRRPTFAPSWGGVEHHAVQPTLAVPSSLFPDPSCTIPRFLASLFHPQLVHPNIAGEERIVTMARSI